MSIYLKVKSRVGLTQLTPVQYYANRLYNKTLRIPDFKTINAPAKETERLQDAFSCSFIKPLISLILKDKNEN